ncbi:GlxA family transcriptional regulator [Pseudomonas luteola]|uniref:GlxA family transcriptional regulator n=1 Tax=Pseudomonas luteola TaxID=47886 RepID=UPI000F79928A|nr:GlxA family transcriptional regulator [Pseudomonas luteola]RRW40648.1 GlxA family transcriptional regulator [Pseudomonas luteola]
MDEKRREFSGRLKEKNLRYLGGEKKITGTARAGFLLLDNFSLPAFTQALDTLVTANLIHADLFTTKTFTLTGEEVVSDLGLIIRPDTKFNSAALKELNLLVVCGGLRTALKAGPELIDLLQTAAEREITLAGLWNGAWFLGRAGLLDNYRCAIHPEHRGALSEIAKRAIVTTDSFIVDRDRLTAAGPNGAFYMMLEWVSQLYGRSLVDGIVDILAFEASRYKRMKPSRYEKMTAPLREIVNLMDANIEEPLEIQQLAEYVGLSRRQIERLFQKQLCTTPQRYYLELRITEARRLLQHSELTVLEVGLACGFVSPSHFSKCYLAYFGHRPSLEKRLEL